MPGTKVIAGAVEVNKTSKISTLIPGVRNDNKEDGEVIYVRLWKVQRRESKQERRGGNIVIMASIFREEITEMIYFTRHEGGKGAISETIWEKMVSNTRKVNATVPRQVCT